MLNRPVSRRSVLRGVVGLGGMALIGCSGPMVTGNGSAPRFPVLAGQRHAPLALDVYAGDLREAGVARDAIPRIENPEFTSASTGSAWLDDGDIVFGFVHAGDARAYPQRIMVWHEVVNDTVAGLPVAITYCPMVADILCIERGTEVFAVSGKLVNSNLTIYDTQTLSYFPQMFGIAVKGEHHGRALVERPVVWTTWGQWRALHPETRVMAQPTQWGRDYNRDPYGSYNPVSGYYAEHEPPMFTPINSDDRAPPKAIFVGARMSDRAVAFSLDRLRTEGRLEVDAHGEDFTALHDPALDTGYIYRGRMSRTPALSGGFPDRIASGAVDGTEPVNGFQANWFAWAGYYPDVVAVL
ncbi:DUF3179 domain-containing protein [Thioalkalivibrio paradoxus]|uniref:DUF3179 domain-containing protein n=1 Tax=Thioalkalivibrio paradoxus ARh 1 TaxID=713585 RepID=W0DP67_9GAMM|nr:DUF3179 domain-containing protein [Thioalkalivibrio paradoxus]AHE98783.1 hypothetical protein THITH_11600 [Thioalkalivibrio paradoxus ARh 1]